MFRWSNKRGAVHSLIVAFFTLPVLFLSLPPDYDNYPPYSYSPFLRWIHREFASLELITVDYRVRFGRRATVNPQIVFLAIDAASTSTYLDSSLDAKTIADSRALTLMHQTFPYPREVWALVCDRLFAAGARAVALDVWFPGPSANDTAWKAAIDHYPDKLIVAMNFSVDPLNGDSPSLSIPSASLFPDQDPFDGRLAYVNYWPDTDDVVRDAQYRNNVEHLNGNKGAEKLPKFYSFAARAVQRGGHPELVPDDLESRTMRYAGPPLLPFKNYSLYEIFEPHSWEYNFKNGEFFRDKIVVVGPQGDFAKDKSSTPYGLMDGAEIHLNAINALLQKDFLARASPELAFSTVIASGLLVLILALVIAQVAWRFLVVVIAVVGYTLVQILAYDGPGWLLPEVAPTAVFFGATGVGFVYDFVLTQIEKLRLRTTFEKYNSKNVVKFLLQNAESYEEMLAGKRRPVTALFSDVRNFTTMAESSDSHALVKKLNEYLTAMVDCLFRYDGTLDCFMGDGIMAVWGNTPYDFGPEEDAARAVRSARAMIVELRRLNAKWLSEGGKEWRVGIGLNHGQVIVGDIGSTTNKRFATIGDAINLASRIEGLTKEYHVELLIGESVAELVRNQFHLRSVDAVKVKGKNQAVLVYTVLGEKSEPLPPDEQKFVDLYEEGITRFRAREFVRAKELFEQALKLQPEDFLTTGYVESCEELIKNPPDETWTGVRVMTKK